MEEVDGEEQMMELKLEKFKIKEFVTTFFTQRQNYSEFECYSKLKSLSLYFQNIYFLILHLTFRFMISFRLLHYLEFDT